MMPLQKLLISRFRVSLKKKKFFVLHRHRLGVGNEHLPRLRYSKGGGERPLPANWGCGGLGGGLSGGLGGGPGALAARHRCASPCGPASSSAPTHTLVYPLTTHPSGRVRGPPHDCQRRPTRLRGRRGQSSWQRSPRTPASVWRRHARGRTPCCSCWHHCRRHLSAHTTLRAESQGRQPRRAARPIKWRTIRSPATLHADCAFRPPPPSRPCAAPGDQQAVCLHPSPTTESALQ